MSVFVDGSELWDYIRCQNLPIMYDPISDLSGHVVKGSPEEAHLESLNAMYAPLQDRELSHRYFKAVDRIFAVIVIYLVSICIHSMYTGEWLVVDSWAAAGWVFVTAAAASILFVVFVFVCAMAILVIGSLYVGLREFVTGDELTFNVDNL